MFPWAFVGIALLAVATLPWALLLRTRIGGIGAIAVITLAVPALVMALMFFAFATGSPLGVSAMGVFLLAAIAGWVWLWRSGRAARTGATELGPHSTPLREWWPVGVGASVALGTFVLGRFLPGAPRVAWAMLGDSASQLVEARFILSNGGISPPPLHNPVPVTSALVAAAAGPGRPGADAGAILAHDLTAYATVWAALIVLSCLLAGAVGFAVVRQSTRLTGTAATFAIAATSLLPLGWFWTGYPIKFGFINAHAVFVIVLASLLAYFATLRRPGLGIGLQVLATALVVLTWSPLAVIPVALALTQAVGTFGWFVKLSRGARLAVVAGVVAGLGLALVVIIPMALAARGSLGIPGGLAEFPKPMLPLAAALLVALALATPQRFTKASLGIVAVALSAVAGLVAVLFLSGQVTGPWTYYPHKYAWLATSVLLTVAFPFALCLVATWRSRALRGIGYGTAALAVAVSLGLGSWWAPGDARFLGNNLPVLILVEDDLPDQGQAPDTVADAVVERAGLERLTIPWNGSIANGYRAAFWLIHLEREAAVARDDAAAADALWTLANFHETADDLCQIAKLVPRGLTVQTADETLSAAIADKCPTADLLVEAEPPGA